MSQSIACNCVPSFTVDLKILRNDGEEMALHLLWKTRTLRFDRLVLLFISSDRLHRLPIPPTTAHKTSEQTRTYASPPHPHTHRHTHSLTHTNTHTRVFAQYEVAHFPYDLIEYPQDFSLVIPTCSSNTPSHLVLSYLFFPFSSPCRIGGIYDTSGILSGGPWSPMEILISN